MRVVRLSESCFIFKELSTDPAPIANSLNLSPPPGLIEAVPAFNQLAVYFDPDQLNSQALVAKIKALKLDVIHPSPDGEGKGWGDNSETPTSNITPPSPDRESLPRTQSETKGAFQNVPPSPDGEGKGWRDQLFINLDASENSLLKIIPACYNGPDLEAVANILNLTIEEFIQIHGQAIFTVEAIGFCPGFPYLAGLPQPLQNLPRKSTPRTAVEPGSIGITGDQCCIYPLVRPGGWNLIAQTPLTLVDPDSNYFPLQVGDKIQFQPISNSQFQQLKNKRL